MSYTVVPSSSSVDDVTIIENSEGNLEVKEFDTSFVINAYRMKPSSTGSISYSDGFSNRNCMFLEEVSCTNNTAQRTMSFDIMAEEGTYDVELFYVRANNRAIASFHVNGESTASATIDMYNSTQSNVSATITLTLVKGKNTIEIKNTTKNASSSATRFTYYGIQMRKQ